MTGLLAGFYGVIYLEKYDNSYVYALLKKSGGGIGDVFGSDVKHMNFRYVL
ncbi:hypothetical protein [Serratia marcescens]|uniref:hypothetical protein n=1 Tax=Serratia marcescens TaxID=615 RepID=UPI0015E1B398|nr:hypothetical protein [Serratia marcescens]